MAETPVNLPDEPTEQSVKQALSAIPTWQEWLIQHHFKPEKGSYYGGGRVSSVDEWQREWKDKGRGWRVSVSTPESNVIRVTVYNSLLRYARSLYRFFVKEKTLPDLIEKIAKIIEKPTKDRTRRSHLRVLERTTPEQTRDYPEEVEPQPVMTPDQMDNLRRLGLMRQEAEQPKKPFVLRSPVPEDPTGISPEDLEKVTRYVKVRCFQPGQRVRVRNAQSTRLNGELGTVVDATAHSCYVAIDSYVEANDPDPFRFEEDELEPIFNESELPKEDEPAAYLASMDYTQMLPNMGYRAHNDAWQRSTAYVKAIELGTGLLRLEIEALPNAINPSAVVVYIEYVSGKPDGRVERIQEIVFDGLDVVDAVREIEQLVASSAGVSDFAAKLEQKNYPGGSRIPTHRKLRQLFGEAFVDEAISAEPDPDDPERYLNDLQRHADVINAFREHGVKMRRRMSSERPYYEMFWIPTAVTDTTYDIKLEPSDQGWIVTASGQKRFYHPNTETEFYEPFDIEDQWYIQTENPDEIAVDVDNILDAIGDYYGPDEPSNSEPDYDDIDEARRWHAIIESIDDIDYRNYAIASANWNPVMLLTSKDVRRIIREAGFKVNTCYKSRITHGWVTTSEPGTDEVFRLMREKPQAMAEYLKDHLRTELIKRFPNLSGQTPQGINMDVFDKKIHLSVWQWSGETSADPENPHNYVMYADIQPADYMKRRRGGRMEETEDPDEIKDIAAYAKGSTDVIAAIQEAGYTFSEGPGQPRWNKYWPLKQPLRRPVPWSPTWTKVWGSPDPWGQYVYGIISEDFPNARDTGYIVVRPIKNVGGKDDMDYATSVRRVLLKAEALMRELPDTNDMDVVRNFLYEGFNKIKDEVNAEADPTWQVEALAVPDPDDPEAYLKRVRQAKMGEVVDVTCPGCGHKRQLLKNWPEDMEGWGSKCEKCDTFIPLVQHVIEAEETEPVVDPEQYVRQTFDTDATMQELGYEFDPTAAFPCWQKRIAPQVKFVVWIHDTNWDLQLYTGFGLHWKLEGVSHVQPLGTLRGKLERWEKRYHEGTLLDQTGLIEGVDDDVDPMAYTIDTMLPDKMLADHGYKQSSEGYWIKPIDPQTSFVVWPGYEGADYTFMVYRDVDGAWQSQGKYAFTAPVRELQQRLEQWEKNLSTVDFTRSGALHKLVGEGIDDPEEVLAAHKPYVYSLWGMYGNYSGAVSFRVFPTLTEAVEAARERRLRDEYDYVWIEEDETKDLSKWDTGEIFAVKYTGIKYEVTSDYSLIKHEDDYNEYPWPPNKPPPVKESAEEEDTVDPKRYIETTFDPVEFLKSSGWFKLKVEAYEYWAKDFPLPHEFVLGGMVFTKLRVVVGFDLRMRGAYSASVIIYWTDDEGRGFPAKNWSLDPQQINPPLADYEEEQHEEKDYDMPLRRFVVEIGTVLSRIKWPPNEKATLLANTHLEADVSKFINDLNYKAKQPLRDEQPDAVWGGEPEEVGEAKIPKVDDPEAFVRNYARGRFYVAGKTAEGETYFWHYGIPSWLWTKSEPDWQSAKEYSDAIGIARNLRGKHVRYPVYDGPLILDVYIVPEKGGDFIRVA